MVTMVAVIMAMITAKNTTIMATYSPRKRIKMPPVDNPEQDA